MSPCGSHSTVGPELPGRHPGALVLYLHCHELSLITLSPMLRLIRVTSMLRAP